MHLKPLAQRLAYNKYSIDAQCYTCAVLKNYMSRAQEFQDAAQSQLEAPSLVCVNSLDWDPWDQSIFEKHS